tara:strand:- start:319 stop:576 length:258 start_codon:yes stop_codon:yes gene_type:complete
MNILEQGIQRFGPAQATGYMDGIEGAFLLLSEFPRSSPERTDLQWKQRMYPFGAHLIFYAIEPDGSILITRIRHGHEDWTADYEV